MSVIDTFFFVTKYRDMVPKFFNPNRTSIDGCEAQAHRYRLIEQRIVTINIHKLC